AVDELRAKGHEVPIDKKKADILVLSSTIEILLFKDALEATVKVLRADRKRRLAPNWSGPLATLLPSSQR
ncbi:MAG: hypothetical protein KJN79_06845, partial [Gammaproteobacteria bacterium]|nr:hypothetical protein [Gammaproteobacteria bacterium]